MDSWSQSGDASSSSLSTAKATPTSSRASSMSRPVPPADPLPLTGLSPTSWRTEYPPMGQFAMTDSEDVVAAGPTGLFYFKRVQDHAAQPWTEAQPLPSTQAVLNNSTVSGLTLHSKKEGLWVYCVANGKLHSFYRGNYAGASFLVGGRPPFFTCTVTKSLAVSEVRTNSGDRSLSLVAPSQTGGLIHTSLKDNSPATSLPCPEIKEKIDYIATDLGIVSALSIMVSYKTNDFTLVSSLLAVCVVRGRLHVVEGPLDYTRRHGECEWRGKTSVNIHHPNHVTGTPRLISINETRMPWETKQLDLLVPSADGGLFHFIRTRSTPDEWHMIARVLFPRHIPLVACMSFTRQENEFYTSTLKAHIQSGGRFYLVKTDECRQPWNGSVLYPILGPGPFYH